MAHVLLTGAGFSHNWGGWLANEAFEYLIGSPEIDDHIRDLLWTHSRGDGFEGALAELQQAYTLSKNDLTRKPLEDLQAAIVGMFNEMNRAFEGVSFEPQTQQNHMKQYSVGPFMDHFDAIFTLNQDLLLESHYLDSNSDFWMSQPLGWTRWKGGYTPGIKPFNTISRGDDPATPTLARMQMPDARANFRERRGVQPYYNVQPYYKLHGSINWYADGDGQTRLLVATKQSKSINTRCSLGIISNSMNTWRAAPG
jgi:hypothetical protein